MCDVCCASSALSATQQGHWAVFSWDPTPRKAKRGRVLLANNPLAPPVAVVDRDPTAEGAPQQAPLPVEGRPYILIQARGPAGVLDEAVGPEGPGEYRIAFVHDGAETPWRHAPGNIAGAMAWLGVDMTWDFLEPALQQAILAKDAAGVEAALDTLDVTEPIFVAANRALAPVSRARRDHTRLRKLYRAARAQAATATNPAAGAVWKAVASSLEDAVATEQTKARWRRASRRLSRLFRRYASGTWTVSSAEDEPTVEGASSVEGAPSTEGEPRSD